MEIRCPERGRKHFRLFVNSVFHLLFGNKMPREGTETFLNFAMCFADVAFGNKMPREGTETEKEKFYVLMSTEKIWK